MSSSTSFHLKGQGIQSDVMMTSYKNINMACILGNSHGITPIYRTLLSHTSSGYILHECIVRSYNQNVDNTAGVYIP